MAWSLGAEGAEDAEGAEEAEGAEGTKINLNKNFGGKLGLEFRV